jgi:GMP synthase-like glutamine amidotransferase
LNIAILKCDDVLEKFQAEFGNYPEMIIDMFSAVETTLNFTTYDVRVDQYPCISDNFDFYVITGSKASVYDGHKWISSLVRYVQALDKAGEKLFGICFGHQIIALAKKCLVEKSDKGWGIGVSSNQVSKRTDWLSGNIHRLNILVSHQDQVLSLPDGADVIAESKFCPYFFVQWGDNMLSVQGHPEWLPAYSKALINDRRDRISKDCVETGLATLSTPLDNRVLAISVLDFIRSKN